MPKRSRRRKGRNMGQYVKGNVDENLAIATLAARTLTSINFDEVMIEKGIITSLVASWSMRDFTAGADDGPILVGLAHGDYTDAEIEAVIENSLSWDVGDKIQQEIARRLVRIVGTFRGGPEASAPVVLNEGRLIKTKLNWTFITGATLKVWAYNLGASGLASSVPDIFVQGHANIFLK